MQASEHEERHSVLPILLQLRAGRDLALCIRQKQGQALDTEPCGWAIESSERLTRSRVPIPQEPRLPASDTDAGELSGVKKLLELWKKFSPHETRQTQLGGLGREAVLLQFD